MEPRIILFWTKYHGSATYDFGLGARPFESAGCRFANCKTTTDRLLLNESHAVIFHHSDVNASDLPTTRLEHQRWIYYTFTSPTNTAPLPRLLKVTSFIFNIFGGFFDRNSIADEAAEVATLKEKKQNKNK